MDKNLIAWASVTINATSAEVWNALVRTILSPLRLRQRSRLA